MASLPTEAWRNGRKCWVQCADHLINCEDRREEIFSGKGKSAGLILSGQCGNYMAVSTVDEIQSAIQQLPEPEYLRLERWWEAFQEQIWDAKLERDSKSGGRLESFLREIDADIDSGNVTSFPQ